MSLFTRLCHTVLDRDCNAAPWLHSSLLLSRTDSSSHASLLTSYKMSFVMHNHIHIQCMWLCITSHDSGSLLTHIQWWEVSRHCLSRNSIVTVSVLVSWSACLGPVSRDQDSQDISWLTRHVTCDSSSLVDVQCSDFDTEIDKYSSTSVFSCRLMSLILQSNEFWVQILFIVV